MRIAFVTIFDAGDVLNWSGTYFHMWKALEAQGFEICLMGNLRHGRSVPRKLRKLWSRCVERRDFLHFWDVATARDYAADVAGRLRDSHADVVVSPTPVPLAFLECPQPRILWTDAGYAALRTAYDEFAAEQISTVAAAGAKAIDDAAGRNCTQLIYASRWGAEWAIRESAAVPKNVHVVPFGANIAVDHDEADVARDVDRRAERSIRLLFIGVDWERKGVEKAIEVVRHLCDSGVDAELLIVGCEPPPTYDVPPFVRVVGFVSKTTAEGREQLAELYRSSHFLIVPTMAEAYGLVFAEASAYGVPSLSHRLGGVETIVRDEVNGRLFEPEEPPAAWAGWVREVVRQPGRLRELALSSFAEYQQRLNWAVAGAAAGDIIRSTVAAPRARNGTMAAVGE